MWLLQFFCKVVTRGGPCGSPLVKKKKTGRKIIKCLLREDGMGGLVRTLYACIQTYIHIYIYIHTKMNCVCVCVYTYTYIHESIYLSIFLPTYAYICQKRPTIVSKETYFSVSIFLPTYAYIYERLYSM